MGIGTSIILIAVGAILKFAVTTSVSGISVHTVGVILMVAGALGLVLSLLYTSMLTNRRRGAVVADPVADPYARERVVERERPV